MGFATLPHVSPTTRTTNGGSNFSLVDTLNSQFLRIVVTNQTTVNLSNERGGTSSNCYINLAAPLAVGGCHRLFDTHSVFFVLDSTIGLDGVVGYNEQSRSGLCDTFGADQSGL